jgi:glycosyltransferase involved in cell wall biosynthesis
MDKGTANLRRLVVAVDLLPLRPAGENGGLKPAVFTLLRAVAAEAQDSLAFLFLTNSASHAQVRDLAGPQDILICVIEEPAFPFAQPTDANPMESTMRSSEFKIAPPPPDFLRTLGADLLYCPFGATTFHVSGIPTIALIVDLLHKDYPYTLPQEEIRHRETYIEETVRVANKLQCISRTGMERLVEHYNVPGERLFYTYLPIHVRLDRALHNSSRATESERPFFYYPANLWIHKNHEVLLVSYALYRQQAGDAAWDLVLTFQEEPRADELRSLAKTLSLSEHVRFAGFLPENELRSIWRTAGALIFPSLHEGFGIPLVEAMHYGVPIITGSEFSLKEVAGDACYPINPRKPRSIASALLEVSKNSELRGELSRRARARLILFDLERAAAVLLREFHSVLRTRNDFPRDPVYCFHLAILACPTPASEETWEIKIAADLTNSDQKLSVYLDNFPYGSFDERSGADGFSFVCRPEARTLVVRRSVNQRIEGSAESNERQACPALITKIVAEDLRGRQILLYNNEEADRIR